MENNHNAFAGAPSMNTAIKGPAYDRQLLLDGAKRNTILDLTEVQRYGIESWGDPDYVCIYGLRPADWYGRGIRILGRTTVECTPDELADNIARDIATVAKSAPLTSEPLLCAIQVYETLDPTSVAELIPRFSWSVKRMYGLNAPGQNH